MAIETRSATKRRALEAMREAQLTWTEYIAYKFDAILERISLFILKNMLLIAVFLIVTVVLIFINPSPNFLFELIDGREPIVACLICPSVGVIMYYTLGVRN
jgi:uncharacterized RDD family membrane protein YckC